MNRNFTVFAAMALGTTVLATASVAETPPNQLVVATSLTNVLSLDPAGTMNREGAQVMNAVYETLIALDPHDHSKLIPALAERWDVSEDGQTITFHLREALFTSGNPVRAEDVAWSLTRMMQVNLAQSSFLTTRGPLEQNWSGVRSLPAFRRSRARRGQSKCWRPDRRGKLHWCDAGCFLSRCERRWLAC